MIPCLNEKQYEELIDAAEQVALRFCSRVYLVGSAITSEFPNDIDIFTAVPGETYLKLFTNYGKKSESPDDHIKNMRMMKVQQAKIYQKQKAYFESKVKSWDFDVKFQALDQFLQHKGSKVRLDKCYEGVW